MLNKKIFLLFLLTSTLSSGLASAQPPNEENDHFLQEHRNRVVEANLKFKLPDEKKIEETLREVSPPDFLEHAKLGTKLAWQHLTELGIDMVLVGACHDYVDSLKKSSESDSSVGTKTRQLWEAKKNMVEALMRVSTPL